jgi:competence protein ComEC
MPNLILILKKILLNYVDLSINCYRNLILKINHYFFKKINLTIIFKKSKSLSSSLVIDFIKLISNFYQNKFNNSNKIIAHQPYNFYLWFPFCFACGCVFYIKYSYQFTINFKILAIVLLVSLISYLFSKNRQKDFSYLLIIGFLFGSFYNFYYDRLIINDPKINHKIIVQGHGKIVNIKKFYNPINHQHGLNLLIENPILSSQINYQLFYENNFLKKQIKKKSKQNYVDLVVNQKNLQAKNDQKIITSHKKSSPKKPRKKSLKNSNSIQKNYQVNQSEKLPKNFKNLVNLKNYQELDRKFLDYTNTPVDFDNSSNDRFLKLINGKNYILLTVNKDQNFYQIGDQIEFYSSLNPAKNRDFIDDFDPRIEAKFRKIFAFGYLIKAHKIKIDSTLENNNNWLELLIINSFKSFKLLFLDLVKKYRELVINKIDLDLDQQNQAMAMALLLGDQSLISDHNLTKIRQSGLTHLLSISGFHLSLASLVCFVSVRYLLAFFPFILLRFNLKKISAIIAIIICYFYLHLANSPIPAQRAFLAVFLVMISYLVNQRFEAIRSVLFSMLILIILNPYILFNVSFQLSFVAILVMLGYYQQYHQKIFYPEVEHKFYIERKFFVNKLHRIYQRFSNYFREIFIVSTIIQIATLPYLMHSFQNFSLIASFTNIFAIPLTSLVIMPSGFLAMILSLVNLQKVPLTIMDFGLKLLQIIIDFFSSFNFASFNTFYLDNLSIALVSIAIFLFCLTRGKFLKFLSLLIFISAFIFSYSKAKPKLIFNASQKISAIINPNYGLEFSSINHLTKRHRNWLKQFQQTEIRKIRTCDKSLLINNYCQKCVKNKYNDYCLIFYQTKKFLVIKNRSQIKKLCRFKNYSVIDLTKKYQLPKCLVKNKKNYLVLDNIDFIDRPTIEIFFDQDVNIPSTKKIN